MKLMLFFLVLDSSASSSVLLSSPPAPDASSENGTALRNESTRSSIFVFVLGGSEKAVTVALACEISSEEGGDGIKCEMKTF